MFVPGYALPDPVAAQLPGHWEAHDAASLSQVRDVVLEFGSARLTGADVELELEAPLSSWARARLCGSPYPPPQLPEPAGQSDDEPDKTDHGESWVSWTQGQDILAGGTWAEVDHGARYGSEQNSTATEHYTGRVEIDRADGAQRLRATARYELDVRDGGELIAEREWLRRIPRTWT